MSKERYLQFKKGSVLILLCICSIYKKETLHTRFCMMNGFQGRCPFFDIFHNFFTFFNVPSLFSIFRVLTQWHSSVIVQNESKLSTWMTVNLPLEKQYFGISCLSSLKKRLKIQIFTYICHFTYCKKCTRFPVDGIFYWVFGIFCQTQALQCLNRYKFDFLTRS